MSIFKHKWMKRLFLFGGILSFLFIACILSINVYMKVYVAPYIYHDAETIPHYQVALVLGTSKKLTSNKLNYYFQYRMEAAANLYQKGIVKKILLSGDNGSKFYNEPMDMKKSLVQMGVDPSDITLDYAGFRTFDSMVRARAIFGLDSFVVISQKNHSKRAVYIARKLGINAVAYVAQDPPISVRQHVREFLARVKAFLDLHIIKTKPRVLGPKETLT